MTHIRPIARPRVAESDHPYTLFFLDLILAVLNALRQWKGV